jgi:hypothetical protein
VWQSGTCPAFARVFRSNSHTAPNYRLPPDPAYHDDELCRKRCWKNPKEKLGHGLKRCPLQWQIVKGAMRASGRKVHLVVHSMALTSARLKLILLKLYF